MKLGLEEYHRAVCRELDLDPDCVATMGTAANMNYAAAIQRGQDDMLVTAVVTAGVQGNAACAGDPTTWSETPQGCSEPVLSAGTINVQLLLNCPVTEGALARAVVTMTEAKTAALQQLAVRSRYSPDLATGTTTDQFCLAAPLRDQPPRRFTSTGIKLGEYIGLAVRDATAGSPALAQRIGAQLHSWHLSCVGPLWREGRPLRSGNGALSHRQRAGVAEAQP